jgi:hypothetical protein
VRVLEVRSLFGMCECDLCFVGCVSAIAVWGVWGDRCFVGCVSAIALIMRVWEGRSLFWGMWGDVRNAIAEMKIVV